MEGSRMITDEDRKVLLGKSHRVLAEWWCQLNSWKWPDEIPNPELPPESAEDWKSDGRRSVLMNWIDEEVGHKLISRIWNKDSMTDEQHEDFYRGCFEGDEKAKARYYKWRGLT